MDEADPEYQKFIHKRWQDEVSQRHQAQIEANLSSTEDEDEDDDYAGCETAEDFERRADKLMDEELRNP